MLFLFHNICSYHQPHWRHLSWVKGVSLSHNMEMRHNEIGIKERLKIFGKKVSDMAKAGLGVQSLRPSVPKSCHRNSSETTDPIIMKLGM